MEKHRQGHFQKHSSSSGRGGYHLHVWILAIRYVRIRRITTEAIAHSKRALSVLPLSSIKQNGISVCHVSVIFQSYASPCSLT